MEILLHACCAPCLIYPLQRLKDNGFSAAVFYYNPNIHPFSEYEKRKNALGKIGFKEEVYFPDYLPQEFFRATNTLEEKTLRCPVCWYLRMERTAEEAKKRKMEYFSTTLLASPYQDQETIKKIGEDIAGQKKLKFYYEDFRLGFKEAHERAKREGIYCQKYCGCIYSEMERCRKSARR